MTLPPVNISSPLECYLTLCCFTLSTAPADYTAVSTQLTFTPTRTSINVPITIAPAVLNEQMESFLANLTLVSPGENNVQLIPDEAEIQITPVGGKLHMIPSLHPIS